jgi:hypothetical protein
MNIFYLSSDVKSCAQQHVDKHVVKMILEYGQLMSTSHRVLDGVPYEGRTINNRRIQRWLLSDDREHIIWKASHVKHPSNIWLRSSKSHYTWLYELWCELLSEYTFRYGKRHSAERMIEVFSRPPDNIQKLGWLCNPPKAMPDQYKTEDTIQSYRNYYIGSKKDLAVWKNREAPLWFT